MARIGISIGRQTLTVAFQRKTGSGYSSLETAESKLPPEIYADGPVPDPLRLGAALQQMMKQAEITATEAAVTVDSPLLKTRLLRLPEMADEALQRTFEDEAGDYALFSGEELRVGFQRLESDRQQCSVLMSVTTEPMVRAIGAALQAAKLKMAALLPPPLALLRAGTELMTAATGAWLLVAPGREKIEFLICGGNRLRLLHTQELPPGKTAGLDQELAGEINRVMDYYAAGRKQLAEAEVQPEKIVILTWAELPPEFSARWVSLPVINLRGFPGLNRLAASADIVNLLASRGTLLKGKSNHEPEINLAEKKRAGERRFLTRVAVGAGLMLLIAGAISGWGYRRAAVMEQGLRALPPSNLAATITQRDALAARLALAQAVVREREQFLGGLKNDDWSRTLAALAGIIPNGIRITKYTGTKEGQMIMSGAATDGELLNRFEAKLGEQVDEVRLLNVSAEGPAGQEQMRFDISARCRTGSR